MYTYMYVYVCICMYVYVYVYSICVCICICICLCICMCIYVYVCVCVCVYVCMYVRMYVCMYVCIWKQIMYIYMHYMYLYVSPCHGCMYAFTCDTYTYEPHGFRIAHFGQFPTGSTCFMGVSGSCCAGVVPSWQVVHVIHRVCIEIESYYTFAERIEASVAGFAGTWEGWVCSEHLQGKGPGGGT